MQYFRRLVGAIVGAAVLMVGSGGAHAQSLATLRAEIASLEEDVRFCEEQKAVLEERLTTYYPSGQNPDGTWAKELPWTSYREGDYEFMTKHLRRFTACIKDNKKKHAELKKDVNDALTGNVGAVETRGDTSRESLQDVKSRVLAQQALLNQLEKIRKSLDNVLLERTR